MAISRRSMIVAIGGVVAALCLLAAVVGVPMPSRTSDLDRLLPAGMTQTHAAVRYYPLSRRTVVTGLVIRKDGHVAATARAVGISGYRAKGGGQELRSLDVRDLRIMLPGGGEIDVAHGQGRDVALSAGVSLAGPAIDLQRVRMIARSIDCGALKIRQMSARVANGSAAIDRVALRGYRGGELKDLLVSDVTAHLQAGGAAAVDVSLHLIHLRDFNGLWLDSERLYTASVASLRDDLQLGTPEQLSMQGLRISSGRFAVGIAEMESRDTFQADASSHSSASLQGGKIDLPKGAVAAPPVAQALRLDGMTFSGLMASTFDKNALRTTLDRFSLSFAGLGTLDMTGSVALDQTRFDASFRKGFLFERANMQWHDAGLTNRLLQLNADQRHFGLEQSRAMIETRAERMGGLLPNQADGGNQLAAFVDKPGTLTLSFNPPVPIAFEAFAGVPRAKLPAVLGIHLSGD